MPARRLWMKSDASGRAIHLDHSAVDHQEDADGKYLCTQPHEHALEPQPQQGTHAPVGKLGLQIAHHAGNVNARVRDDDPRRLADHILRHIKHRHDDVPGIGDDQHRAEGLENPLEENPGVEVVEVVLLDDKLDQLVLCSVRLNKNSFLKLILYSYFCFIKAAKQKYYSRTNSYSKGNIN